MGVMIGQSIFKSEYFNCIVSFDFNQQPPCSLGYSPKLTDYWNNTKREDSLKNTCENYFIKYYGKKML